ncbi:MAG: hypothetical protein J6M42_03895 [Clostridia bacterium]|nr:hypothetical protein [Clostridia bacterium]
MKQPTDKDLRLYASLSDVDSDLILDSTIPLKPVSVPSTKKAERPSFWAFLCRPQNASVALAALLVTLTVVALLVTGITKGPQTEPPPHGTHTTPTDPIGSVKTPTVEDAAALRKGMSLSELVSLMGNNYTQEGTRYTFTLDTGEQLAVDTEYIYGGTVGACVTGFEWLGSAGKTYNPMGIPAEILQKLQDYATDTVIPIYAMTSLIGQYDSTTPPTLDEILKDAEVHYLRMGADGETALLDGEGHGAGGYMQGEAFSFLEDVSALFDESVRVKAYYPIMTSSERGAVYLQTSIGDYILYLHQDVIFVLEGDDPPANDPVPYLLPVGVFHRFAYGMVDQSVYYGIGWAFTEERMAIIEPYKMTAEGYQKPVNIATPEAAEQIKVGDRITNLTETLGICRRCAGSRALYYDKESGKYILPTPLPLGLHYWELTDGSGLVIYADTGTSVTDESSSVVYLDFHITYKERVDVSVLEDIGTPTVATASLLTEGMESAVAEALLGTPLKNGWSGEANYSVWEWQEDGMAHTVQVYWSTQSDTGKQTAATVEHTVRTVEETLGEIKPGISFADIVARLGPCRDGHEVDYWGGTNKHGYHFWSLPDGRWLAAYVGYDIPILSDPFGMTIENHFNMSVMQILWLDSEAEIEAIGTPSLSRAQCIEAGMKPAVVQALMGEPTATISTLASMWEWSEDGKTYTCTVYLQNNRPEGLFKNFDSVYRCEITEGPMTSLPIPDKDPTPEDAARVTEGMTASDLIKLMGSRVQRTTLVDAELYCWTLTDGRAFCVLAEGDLTCPMGNERVVTYTFYRGSMADVSVSTAESMEAVTEGMSLATVFALLGTELWDEDYDYPSSLTVMWGTLDGAWWEITVTFEAVEYPETNRSRAYAVSVYIDKGE